jgi:hypothetical protein
MSEPSADELDCVKVVQEPQPPKSGKLIDPEEPVQFACEVRDKLWSVITPDRAGEPMELPDLLQVEPCSTFCVDCGVHGHEVHLLSNAIDYVHDHIVAVCIGKLNHKVNSDCIPSLLRSLCWM